MNKFTMGLLLGAVVCSAGPITYTVGQTVGVGGVTGTIETDGTIGVIAPVNILDWNLLLNDGTTTDDLTGPLSGSDSTLTLISSDLTASATQLLFNFSASDNGFALFQANLAPFQYWCVETATNTCTLQGAGEDLVTNSADQFSAFSGNDAIGTAPGGSGTPEPSTISFMGLGLAALGFWKLRAGAYPARTVSTDPRQ